MGREAGTTCHHPSYRLYLAQLVRVLVRQILVEGPFDHICAPIREILPGQASHFPASQAWTWLVGLWWENKPTIDAEPFRIKIVVGWGLPGRGRNPRFRPGPTSLSPREAFASGCSTRSSPAAPKEGAENFFQFAWGEAGEGEERTWGPGQSHHSQVCGQPRVR